MKDVKEQLEDLLVDVLTETRVDLKKAPAEIAKFAAERVAHLATLVDDPGFQEAVRAERDAVALEAGIAVVEVADAVDARISHISGVIQGMLALASRSTATP